MRYSGPTSTTIRRDQLHGLRETIEAIEGRSPRLFTPSGFISTGWGPADAALRPPEAGDFAGSDAAGLSIGLEQASGGLACGSIHDWFGLMGGGRRDSRVWIPPIAVLSHLAGQALESRPGRVVWVGRQCWPYPRSLRGRWGARLLAHSLFVDAQTLDERVWVADQTLRCPGVAAVIADARGVGMAESRRLQLAAAAGGTPGFLARPPSAMGEISAAWTAWRVRPAPSPVPHPRWEVELLRCKARLSAGGAGWSWLVHREEGSSRISLVAPRPEERSLAGESRAAG